MSRVLRSVGDDAIAAIALGAIERLIGPLENIGGPVVGVRQPAMPIEIVT